MINKPSIFYGVCFGLNWLIYIKTNHETNKEDWMHGMSLQDTIQIGYGGIRSSQKQLNININLELNTWRFKESWGFNFAYSKELRIKIQEW